MNITTYISLADSALRLRKKKHARAWIRAAVRLGFDTGALAAYAALSKRKHAALRAQQLSDIATSPVKVFDAKTYQREYMRRWRAGRREASNASR